MVAWGDGASSHAGRLEEAHVPYLDGPCFVLVGAIVGLLVTITMLRIDGSEGEPDEREGRRMLEAVLELVEARR